MTLSKNNYAFIDSQNFYLGIKKLGWQLDYHKFRVYLREKYGVEKRICLLVLLNQTKDYMKILRDVGLILFLNRP